MVRLELATQLRKTATRLKAADDYRWTHQGRCNCGFLAQTLTGHTAARIHQMAVQAEGEWKDHAAAFCENSGMAIDLVIKEMLSFGLTVDDLADLEYLRAPDVVRWMPSNQKHPDYRRKEDVVAYFETWASVIEARETYGTPPMPKSSLMGERSWSLYPSEFLLPLMRTPTAVGPQRKGQRLDKRVHSCDAETTQPTQDVVMRSLGKLFSQWAHRYVPDPFVLALGLTLAVCLLALPRLNYDLTELANGWVSGNGAGLWRFLAFSMQMCLISSPDLPWRKQNLFDVSWGAWQRCRKQRDKQRR